MNNFCPPILIVEDNLVNQQVIGLFLQQLSIPTHYASNGEQAVELAQENDYAIILMDIEMPVLDGLEATHRIRSTFPAERQPAIIALTAHQKEDTADFLERGFDAILFKPVRPEALKSICNQYLPTIAQQDKPQPLKNVVSPSNPRSFTPEVLDKMRSDIGEGSTPLLSSLITTFLDHTLVIFENIQTAQQNHDLNGIYRSVHSLKSSSANLGAIHLSELCAAWEVRLKPLVNNPSSDNPEERLKAESEIEPTFGSIRQAYQTASIDLLVYQRHLDMGLIQKDDQHV
jgi:CheY-like chemotaxis protein